ncbi:cupin-like domain-containing protein [Archangium violaceum]|uniref:cupin-like domain-containing protein n=1 Tax=Archangium violaceum TaxID=83451 RepID=UPI00194DE424|nr:cupin-like domain-containing protein [Archangium violaceum]QRN95003.1 cupin-like domain-containing protein [Archangium violaceum]
MLAPAPAPRPSPHGEPSLALPRSFWKDFARKHWDRQPTVLQRPFAAHFPTPGEIFEALLETSARYRRGEFTQPLRFYIEHMDGPGGMPYYSVLFDLSRHLPQREDGDLDGYLARLDSLLGGKRFGIVLNRAQCFQWNHWLQMTSFLSGFHEALGVPLGGSDSCVFLGNYRYTPFGVHKDDLHVFYFVIDGEKTMSLWPFDALADRQEVPKDDPDLIHKAGLIYLRDKEDEQRVLAKATTLVGRPGDVMYWPASYWHRAEPSRGLNISASLGVSFRPPPFTGMAPPGEWPRRLRHTELPAGPRSRLPEPVRKSLQRRSRRQDVLSAERESTSEWVRFLTGGALEGTPLEAREEPLKPQEWILASRERPIVSVPLPQGQVLVSANGRSATLTPAPAVLRRVEKLLTALNSGKPQQVEALEEAFFSRLTARSFNTRAFRALLDDLVRWRAVRRCEPPSSRAR